MSETAIWLTTAGEYGPLAKPRRCILIGELTCVKDNGTLLALTIEPAFSDASLLPPAVDENVVLVGRAMGSSYSLTAQQAFSLQFDSPLLVRVSRLLNKDVLVRERFTPHETQLLPRGALFRKLEDAVRFAHDLGVADIDVGD